jgi:hypothetical protein
MGNYLYKYDPLRNRCTGKNCKGYGKWASEGLLFMFKEKKALMLTEDSQNVVREYVDKG